MKRYAIYYTAPPGAFATAAAAWLGYDVQTGRDVAQAHSPGLPRPLADITTDPRKYGFHGTINAPFRLADGYTAADLAQAGCVDRHGERHRVQLRGERGAVHGRAPRGLQHQPRGAGGVVLAE